MVEQKLAEAWEQLMSLERAAELGPVELLPDELALIRHTVEEVMAELGVAVPPYRTSHGG